MADWAYISASALGFLKSTNTKLLDILKGDGQLLESIQTDFLAMVRELREARRDIKIMCFYEELSLPSIGKVVSKDSATLDGYAPRSIHADHRDMVRFATTEDDGFTKLLAEVRRWTSQIGKNTYYCARMDLI